MPNAPRTSHFNVALFATPKTPTATETWWARPEVQQDRAAFYAMIEARAATVFAASALPIHQGKMR